MKTEKKSATISKMSLQPEMDTPKKETVLKKLLGLNPVDVSDERLVKSLFRALVNQPEFSTTQQIRYKRKQRRPSLIFLPETIFQFEAFIKKTYIGYFSEPNVSSVLTGCVLMEGGDESDPITLSLNRVDKPLHRAKGVERTFLKPPLARLEFVGPTVKRVNLLDRIADSIVKRDPSPWL